MNGGQDGGPGFPAPGGDQWPNQGSAQGAQGGTPYGAPPQPPYGAPPPAPYGDQPGWGNTQPGPYGGPTGPMGPGGQDPQGMWAYGQGAPPPKKSRKGLVTGVVVAAAVIVLGGAAAAVGVASSGDDKKSASASGVASPSSAPTSPVDSGVPHSIVTPASVGPYKRLNGSLANRLASTMRKSMGASGDSQYADVYRTAKIAIYSKDGDTERPLIFVGLQGSDSPQIAEELKSNSPSQEVDATFLGMGIGDAEDYPAGPLGGALRCGTGAVGAGNAAACAWADSSTVGMVIQTGGNDVKALSKTTLDLRNSAER